MSDIKPFEGRSAQMRISQWLAWENLDGLGDVEVTIEGVFSNKDVTMQDGKKKSHFSVKFVGKEMQLVLNATNRKSLVAKFGTDVKAWKGQKITLYVQDNVRNPAGGTTKGIRIK